MRDRRRFIPDRRRRDLNNDVQYPSGILRSIPDRNANAKLDRLWLLRLQLVLQQLHLLSLEPGFPTYSRDGWRNLPAIP